MVTLARCGTGLRNGNQEGHDPAPDQRHSQPTQPPQPTAPALPTPGQPLAPGDSPPPQRPQRQSQIQRVQPHLDRPAKVFRKGLVERLSREHVDQQVWSEVGHRPQQQHPGDESRQSVTLVLDTVPSFLPLLRYSQLKTPASSRMRSVARRAEISTVATPLPGWVLAPTKYRLR